MSILNTIKQYAPEKVELPEFDMSRKNDYIYCVDWGMRKAQKNEYEVYQKMIKELTNL